MCVCVCVVVTGDGGGGGGCGWETHYHHQRLIEEISQLCKLHLTFVFTHRHDEPQNTPPLFSVLHCVFACVSVCVRSVVAVGGVLATRRCIFILPVKRLNVEIVCR